MSLEVPHAALDGNRRNSGYAAFREALLAGRIAFGSTLRQEELCEILGMSLSPLRETLSLVEADGLVTVRRRLGVKIFYPDINFVRSNFQFRGLIEREAVGRFAESVTDDWLEDMNRKHAERLDAIERTRHDQSSQRAVRLLESEFHGAFVAALKNDLIAECHLRLMENLNLIRVIHTNAVSANAANAALHEHLAILKTLAGRDPSAATQALDHHLRSVIHRLFSE